ncbi:hypothetical protein [Aliiroseovarius crassostreae]|uniref:hypothetical protein n=1 Tax=Aliiroseovarius crassostreae TaxID=154981 RepID=UPI0021FE8EC6|nr:hypothetical protein [Aliiroseovarius crassostreae]UWQ05940.1 hypothetical protein K3X22_05785 [Aliiroseovarius crassostreae]
MPDLMGADDAGDWWIWEDALGAEHPAGREDAPEVVGSGDECGSDQDKSSADGFGQFRQIAMGGFSKTGLDFNGQ